MNGNDLLCYGGLALVAGYITYTLVKDKQIFTSYATFKEGMNLNQAYKKITHYIIARSNAKRELQQNSDLLVARIHQHQAQIQGLIDGVKNGTISNRDYHAQLKALAQQIAVEMGMTLNINNYDKNPLSPGLGWAKGKIKHARAIHTDRNPNSPGRGWARGRVKHPHVDKNPLSPGLGWAKGKTKSHAVHTDWNLNSPGLGHAYGRVKHPHIPNTHPHIDRNLNSPGLGWARGRL